MKSYNTRNFKWVCIIFSALVLLMSGLSSTTGATKPDPSMFINGKHSGIHKDTNSQSVTPKHWTNFQGGGFKLNGKKTLFFAQLHLACTKKPKYVKIRLARHHKDGSLDTTGTNTWVTGKGMPNSWQGTIWWESNTKYLITAQFYVSGGNCYSPQRQFKWWQP